MPRATALTAKGLPASERKARLQKLVDAGKISPARAKLIDFREPSEAAKAFGRELAARRAKAPVRRAAA